MAAIIVMSAGTQVAKHTVNSSPFVVGRDPKNGVALENVGVSRRHCQFTCENGRFFVEDLGSSNGTFIQGKRIRKAEVSNGDEVNVGKFTLLFEDTGLDFLPVHGRAAGARPGASAAPAGGAAPVDMTFQMDTAEVQAQMAVAGSGAAERAEAKRAADSASAYDPARLAEMKEKKGAGHYLGYVLRVGGLVVIGTGLLFGLLYALGIL